MGDAILLSAVAIGGTAGLVSSVHCASMCGPVAAFAAAAPAGLGRARHHRLAAWLMGRIAAYAAVGAVVGTVGLALTQLLPVRLVQVAVSLGLALALAALGLRLLAHPVAKSRAQSERVVPLRNVAPRRSPSTRVLVLFHDHPFALGAAMALVPCGALYAALAAAALEGEPVAGALTMIAFATTSSVGLLLAGAVARVGGVLDPGTRRALGAVLVVGALVLGLRPWWPADAAGPACHASPGVESAR